MKILLVGNHPLHWGGLSKAGKMILHALDNLEHKCDYMVVPTGGEVLGAGTLNNYNNPVNVFPQSQVDYLKLATENKYDLIITIGDLWHFEAVYKIVTNLSIPWVAYFGCEGIIYPPYVRVKSNELINIEKLFEVISACWVYGASTQIAIEKYTNKFDIPVNILPHYYEPIKPIEIGIRNLLNIDNSKKIALYIGINNIRKGVDLFIHTLIRSPGWVGYMQMPAFDDLGIDGISLRNQLGLEKRLYFWDDLSKLINGNELADNHIQGLYSECDLYYHPHRGEGFGLTIQDALQSGIKVSATGTGGVADYLNECDSLPIKNQKYVKLGGIQYIMNEPDTSESFDVLYAKERISPNEPLTPMGFTEIVHKLLENPLKPKIWRQWP